MKAFALFLLILFSKPVFAKTIPGMDDIPNWAGIYILKNCIECPSIQLPGDVRMNEIIGIRIWYHRLFFEPGQSIPFEFNLEFTYGRDHVPLWDRKYELGYPLKFFGSDGAEQFQDIKFSKAAVTLTRRVLFPFCTLNPQGELFETIRISRDEDSIYTIEIDHMPRGTACPNDGPYRYLIQAQRIL